MEGIHFGESFGKGGKAKTTDPIDLSNIWLYIALIISKFGPFAGSRV